MAERDVKVSVIMLTYNHERFLRQAIESVLMQKTSFPFELLIGDDASTDGTGRIAREYADRFPDVVRAFIRPHNLMACKNLYDLLVRARGKYIASCEGDDYWTDPEKLQKQVDFLESHPNFSGCTHACLLVDDDGRPLVDQCLPWECRKQIFELSDFKGLYLPGQPATLVHINFMRDRSHNYSIIQTAHPQVADRTIMFILCMSGPVWRDSAVMSCYRVHSDNSPSVTRALFADNADVNLMQVRYVSALERYGREEFGVKACFLRFKTEQRLKALLKRTILKSYVKRRRQT